MRAAHGEDRLECHVLKGAQCAGAAIYRANVAKRTRDPALLRLPRDAKKVFANYLEFMIHHGQRVVKEALDLATGRTKENQPKLP